MKSRLLPLIFLLLSLLPGWAETRLAILADEGAQPVADLLTAQLSQSPEVKMVERKEIQHIAAEYQLHDLTSQGDFKGVGALLNANGLIVLTRDAQSKPAMATARLIAVEPGVVIDTMAFPVSDKAEPDATAIQAKFGPLLEKVRLQPGRNAVAISLLGLKFDMDSLQAKATENQLNRLLADRLIHEPNFLVLERWRMEALAWEKSLTGTPAPFWTGSYLLEGTLHRQGKTLMLSVHLKKADATKKEIQLSGSEENLPGIADELTGKLKAELGTPGGTALPWDKAAEAENYARLADWALANELPDDAVSAIESAIALGLAKPNVKVLQIRAYSMLAYPDNLLVGNHMYSAAKFKNASLLPNLEAATEAVTLLGQFEKIQTGVSCPQMFTLEHSGYLAPRVLMTAFRVLRRAHETGIYIEHPAEVAALRAAVRQTGSDANAMPGSLSFAPNNITYAPYWTETPEQTIAVYRAAVAKPIAPAGEWGTAEFIRLDWSMMPGRYPCFDNPELPNTHGPWLVAWKPEQEQRLPELWRAFIDELKHSTSLQAQIDGMMFEYLSMEHHEGLLGAICDCLWNRRSEIFGPESHVKINGLERAVRDCWSSKNAPETVQSFPVKMLCYMLEQHVKTDTLTWGVFLDLNRKWTEEEAKTLEPLLSAFEQSLPPAKTREDKKLLSSLSHAHNALLRQYPALAPQDAARPTEIAVGHFWNMFAQAALHELPKDLHIEQPRWIDGRLWFSISKDRRICGVNPVSHDLVTFQWPESPDPEAQKITRGERPFEVTPEAIFLAERADVLRCERASGQWKRLDLPSTFYMLRSHGGALYLPYPQTEHGNPTVGSGLLKLNIADESYEVLFSSRRIPRVNPLDGKSENKPSDVFEDRKGNVYFWWLDHTIKKWPGHISESRIYKWSDEQKSWEKEFSTDRKIHLKDERPGALIMTEGVHGGLHGNGSLFANFDQIVLLNPDSGQFELLLENPEAEQYPLAQTARWDFPPELCRNLPGANRCHEMAWNNGTLWIIAYDRKHGDWGGSNFVLFAFLPRQKTALQIPLRFDVSEEDKKDMKGPFTNTRSPHSIEKPFLAPNGVFATEKGLVITALVTPGFWFLPYSEIPQLTPAAAPQ